MDLTLSRRGDYVVRAALALALAWDGPNPSRKLRQLVAEMELPPTYAAQIMGRLVQAGLATARAGRSGGYRLSREPTAITLLEVVEAAEGPLRAARCSLSGGPCHWQEVCPLHPSWSRATMALRTALAATSLRTLADDDRAIAAGELPIPVDSHRQPKPAGARSPARPKATRTPTAGAAPPPPVPGG